MITCIGEILVDIFKSYGNQPNSGGDAPADIEHAGGAPFNVACGARKLSGEVGFIGCVGDDTFGHKLVSFADDYDFDYLDIAVLEGKKTLTACVTLSESGERSFKFNCGNDCAVDCNASDISNLLSNTNILHIGSLLLFDQSTRARLLSVVEQAEALGAVISFDVNYRDEIFGDFKSAWQIIEPFVNAAHILKLSTDELLIIPDKGIFKDKIVFITRGSEGSTLIFNGSQQNFECVPIDGEVVDTTGAGDSFLAAALVALDSMRYNSDITIEDAVRFATVASGFTVRDYGAIQAMPTLSIIEQFEIIPEITKKIQDIKPITKKAREELRRKLNTYNPYFVKKNHRP